MNKKKYHFNENQFLDNIEYINSIIIAILFAIGLIPFTYSKVSSILITLILIQIIISAIRFRLLNVIIELALLILSIISFIPILGFITRFIGIIFAIIESASFKNKIIYEKIEINTINKFKTKQNKKNNKQNNKEKSKNKEKIYDAEFKEK